MTDLTAALQSTLVPLPSPHARAEQALDFVDTKKRLEALARESERIVAITNPAGYEECHAALMKLRNTRVGIEKIGKAARDDANAFAKAVIGKENELIAIIDPEETRLRALRDAEDARREKIKADKAEAERRRVAALHERLAAIRAYPLQAVGKSAELVATMIEQLKTGILIDDSWDELGDEAALAKTAVLDALVDLHTKAVTFEAEQAALAEQRRALEAEQARLAAEHAALAAEEAAARAAREAAEEAARKERDAQEAAERAERRQQEEAAREAREAQARQQREAEEAAAKAERERIAAGLAAEAARLAEQRAQQEREREAFAARQREEQERRDRETIERLDLEGAADLAAIYLEEIGHGHSLACRGLRAALTRKAAA